MQANLTQAAVELDFHDHSDLLMFFLQNLYFFTLGPRQLHPHTHLDIITCMSKSYYSKAQAVKQAGRYVTCGAQTLA